MTVEETMKTYSLAGKGLKLDTEQDVDEYVKAIRGMEDMTHIVFSGNTFGVDASKAIALALKEKHSIQVETHALILVRLTHKGSFQCA